MTGFCGVVGERSHEAAVVVTDLRWTGRERTQCFDEAELSVADVARPDEGDRPVETEDGHQLWVWGTVFGCETDDSGYDARPTGEPTTDYCARLCERAGLDFLPGLNGHYVGLVFDPASDTVHLFTDRLGTVDAYFATPDEDTLLVSSHLQSLQRWPGTEWSFDVDALAEFFTYTRSMGVKTPLQGAELLPPATVRTIDLDSMTWTDEQYWRPRHRPVDAPFEYFVDEFVDRFRASIAERTAATGEYGLLLSGGADSRIVAAALGGSDDATAYHMANWMSREARTAERVALTAGLDFELLHRDRDHLARQLRRTPRLSNFQGKFNQAQAEAFLPALRDSVDYLVDGLYADILFKGWGIPRRTLPLGPLGQMGLPLAGPVDSVAAYLDEWATEIPQYVRSERSMRDILAQNISVNGDVVDHHGVPLDSPVELMGWSHVFPQTNMGGGFQIRSIRQHLPYRNPMLDNRLLDLSLSMPLEYHVRRNVIEAALERMAPDLAAIPHSDTGVPMDAGFPANWIRRYANEFWRSFVETADTPRPDLGHGPWEPHGEVIRVREFVEATLRRHEKTIRALPFLDWDGAWACYREHLDGADNARALYMLVTFLEMPLTQRLAADTAPVPQSPTN